MAERATEGEILLRTMLTLIQEIRQEHKNNIGVLHGRVNGTECRLDCVEAKIMEITQNLNNGQQNPSRQKTEDYHVELEELPNGRLICPLCKKDYCAKYVRKHVENVCLPKIH